MAKQGTGYFDNRGQFFRTADEATRSDLAALLGKIGDGESLAPGIAHTLLDKRAEIERLFAEHDAMLAGVGLGGGSRGASNITALPQRKASAS